MILTIGLIKADLVTAGQAIEYFEATSNKNIKNIAAYHLQQATEKLIKYQIVHWGRFLCNSPRCNSFLTQKVS